MTTTLRNCEVPWSISPSSSGVTLIHEETDVEPLCRVVLGAGRLNSDGRTDLRRIEIVFELAYFTRTTPHSDYHGPSEYGFDVVDEYQGNQHNEWRKQQWLETGICPDSGFYVADSSDWLESVPKFCKREFKHYLLDGRDGHVELLASKYRWAEWMPDENRLDWSEVWPLETAVHNSTNGG